jgi:acetyl esterase
MALHPQSREMLTSLAALPPQQPGEDVDGVRASVREAALADETKIGLDHIADIDADGVPCRLYRPRAGAPVALYVHGGGWVLHDLETHDAFCRFLAHETGWALLAVDYRRAPEHPYPAPLDDVQTGAHWLREHGRAERIDTSFIPAIGDSSGANLIAGLCVREPGAIDFQVLLYPPVDPRGDLDGPESNAALDTDTMRWFWEAYAPGDLADQPEVAVLRADNLADHPPALIVTNEHDILRDQGEAYAARLSDAGVEVMAVRALGMVHSFWRHHQIFDAARAMVTMVGATLDTHRTRTR